jgi:uncharacterized protein
MAAPAFDPRHLDVKALAAAQSALSGQWPLASLPRLRSATVGESDALVDWAVQGKRTLHEGVEAAIWLELTAKVTVHLQCQRCLDDVAEQLAVRRRFRFVSTEAEAEQLDENSEDDVLALEHPLDLRALVEDEMILSLPLLPRHEVCPRPIVPPPSQADEQTEESPFAALKGWRPAKGRPGDGH